MINMFSNLTQSMGVLLNGVIINLASFAVVERASFSSFSRLCVACNYASIFSCLVRALLVASATQLNGSPLLAVVLVWLQIVFFPFPCLFPLVCYLRTSQAFLCPQEMWNAWLSRPSSIVSSIEEIHHDLFLIPLLAK